MVCVDTIIVVMRRRWSSSKLKAVILVIVIKIACRAIVVVIMLLRVRLLLLLLLLREASHIVVCVVIRWTVGYCSSSHVVGWLLLVSLLRRIVMRWGWYIAIPFACCWKIMMMMIRIILNSLLQNALETLSCFAHLMWFIIYLFD